MRLNHLYLLLFSIFLISCSEEKNRNEEKTEKVQSIQNEFQLVGKAQGTTYSIKYIDEEEKVAAAEVDSLLKAIDASMSTWVDTSIISKINKGGAGKYTIDGMFREVFLLSQKVQQESNGAFDVSLAPVIYAWGIGFSNPRKLEKAEVDSLLLYTGMDKFKLENEGLLKKIDEAKLDFNAIAQGYSVDLLAELLKSKGIENYMVELGGEVKTLGKNKMYEHWRIGIDKARDQNEERELQAIISLEDNALATSGNYRKYYELDGQRYSHSIDPKSGFPVNHHLLSASVITDNCAEADAYATALMVMGLERAKEFLSSQTQLKAFLIYFENGEYKSFMTENLKGQIELLE